MIAEIMQGIFANGAYDILKKIYATNTYIEQSKNLQEPVENENNSVKENEFSLYSNKLNNFLDIINKFGTTKITVSKLAEIIDEDTAEYTIRVFNGTSLATKEFLSKLYLTFNFNINYYHGTEENVFDTSHSQLLIPEHYLEEVKKYKVEKLYFIIDERGYVLIIEKIKKFLFKILCNNIEISQDVGATGLSKMVSLAKLIKNVQSEQIQYSSYIVSTNDYQLLVQGNVYFEVFDSPKVVASTWAEDYYDKKYYINNKNLYLDKYGKNFVSAMELIIDKI